MFAFARRINFNVQNVYLLFMILGVMVNYSSQETRSNKEQCEVERFEDIINDGIKNALRFVEPRDATQYAANEKCTEKEKDLDETSYDYIIIGSGAAGSVVANRLSEIEDATVLVIEAGHFENDFIDIPGLSTYAPGTEYNWAYKSIPQKSCCLGMVNKQCQFHRGRGIGGTTLINSVVYSRGSAEDYNKWNISNPGWAYSDVLPYFIKSENAQFDGADEGYHGTGGLYNVEISSYTTPHLDAFILANEQLGYKQIDYNGKEHVGVSRIQYNTKNGRRLTTGSAFIRPAIKRKNLKLSIDSYVTKINFEETNNNFKATSVDFLKNGCEYNVKITKEVILSAGAIGSPNILLHSGIGPKQHLEDVKVKPLLDLPVGENLQDHIAIKGLSIESNTSIEINPLEENIKEYLHGQGPYTLAAAHGAVGFYKIPKSKHEHAADVEFVFITPNRTSAYFQRFNGFSDETTKALTENLDNPSTMSVILAMEHPESVGYIRLKSNNPLEYPLIDPRFLDDSHDNDIEVLYQGLLLLRKMVDTHAMKALHARFKKIELPACKQHEMFSKGYWYCFIRETSDELFHPVGTCKMGPKDQNGVVDSKLKVHGVDNLRVADASVIPFSMVGHTSAPSVMIGERCADFIKEGHHLS